MNVATSVVICLTIWLGTELSEGFFFNLDPEWTTLRTTYGTYLVNPWAFDNMPLTRREADSRNFKQIGGRYAPCKGIFLGYRYLLNFDPAVITLYDVNGYLAGVQTGFLEKKIKKSESLDWFKNSSMFTVEELPFNQSISYTLTAYLVNTSIICTTGRTEEEFTGSEGGIDLYLKNGTQNIILPKKQSDLSKSSWVEGKCIKSMGVHYWYDISHDMECDHFQPVFLLYNQGRLTGFGWAVLGNFTSKRYDEHSFHKLSLTEYFERVPSCLFELYDRVGGFSTQHIYMSFLPWNLLC